MNKIKLLAPLFTTALTIGSIVPIATSCTNGFNGEVNETEWQQALENIYSPTKNLVYYTDGYVSSTHFNKQGQIADTTWYTNFIANNELQQVKAYETAFNSNAVTLEEETLTTKRFYDSYLSYSVNVKGGTTKNNFNLQEAPVNNVLKELFNGVYDKYREFKYVQDGRYYIYFDSWEEDWLNITISFDAAYRINTIEFVYVDLVSPTDPTVSTLSSGDLTFIYQAKPLEFPTQIVDQANPIVYKMGEKDLTVSNIKSKEYFDNRVIITLNATEAHANKNIFTFKEMAYGGAGFKKDWCSVYVDGVIGGSGDYQTGTIVLTEPIKAGQKINICVGLEITKEYTCTLS